MSASRSTSSALVYSPSLVAMPTLAVTATSCPSISIGAARLACIRSTIGPTALGSMSWSRTANSSPPNRAARSVWRSPARSRSPILRQEPITGEVAERVVDELEPVEVEEHHGVAQLGVTGAPGRWSRLSRSRNNLRLGRPVTSSYSAPCRSCSSSCLRGSMSWIEPTMRTAGPFGGPTGSARHEMQR